ncbi:hypothetical protein [Allocoleopsis franciscana]|uniref:Uncharacterized protein n=1 Tax=Allocoleopsis franciscana PCC 7113 TaxID=1173027 RepID=K9WNF8_9CYAN|nr:hypothetical protein [Allocoleopsis franciscana]AFZ21718.1 hypothetical protein Mic7113_6124 [Allocoleopsis franciscana PCC 7113]
MSPSVNRSPDSPKSSGTPLPETSSVPSQAPTTPTGEASNVTTSAQEADSTGIMSSDVQRQQPIPPPSEPMQYRAIGLIRGQYMPSAEQLTRGTLLAADGTLIDAVLLGRVMSLVKNHLSLDQSHLWVVYPRSRQEDGNLHVQIVGVWEPEKLQKTPSQSPTSEEAPEEPEEPQKPEEPEGETPPDPSESEVLSVVQNGYFSIRGEVIYHSREEEQVIVKIKQSPRKEADKTKFFKLKLKGLLGDRVVGHFWDLHIQLEGNTLGIQEANDIGLLPAKKYPKKKPFNKRRPGTGGKKYGSNQRPMRKGERPATATGTPTGTATGTPPKRREPVPKPVKRNEKSGGGNTSGNPSS